MYTVNETNSAPGGNPAPALAKYVNLPDGFYRLRIDGQSLDALPKSSSPQGVIFHGRAYASINDLIAALTTPPVPRGQQVFADSLALVLPYPQTMGQPWRSFNRSEQHLWALDKSIGGRETIQVALGWLDCEVIQWIFDPPPEGLEVTEWIAPEGLARRVIKASEVIIPTYQNPYEGDTADVTMTLQLKSFEIR